MLKSEWTAVALFAIALAIIVTASFSPTWEAFWLAIFGQTAAAWVQAVGVFIAVYLTGRQAALLANKSHELQEDRARRDRKLAADQFTRLLLPYISALRDDAVLKQRIVSGFPGNMASNDVSNYKLVVPPRLEDAVFSLKADPADFGGVGNVVICAQSYNSLIDVVRRLNLNEHGVSDLRERMQSRRKAVISACEKVLGIFQEDLPI